MNAAFWIGFAAYVVVFASVVYGIGTIAAHAERIRLVYPDETQMSSIIFAAADAMLRWFSLPAGLAGLLAFSLAIYLDANPHGATACLVVSVCIINMLRTHKAPNVS